MKKFNKLIAVLLSIAILISVTPVISADADSEVSANNTVIGETDTYTVSKPYIISELSEKRTSNTKTFLMSDRTETVAVYNTAVHYMKNGTWEDVDNSFYSADDNSIENRKNTFKTKFSKKSNKNHLVELSKNGYEIKWYLPDCKKSSAEYTKTNDTDSGENMSALKNITGEVLYKNILTDTDISYNVSSNGVKENIILKSVNAPQEFTFDYEYKELTCANDNGNIAFYNSQNEPVFQFDKLYMYDSARAMSEDIDIEITETNKGVSITIKPDKDWLKSNDREWPIVVDPGIVGTQNATDVWDIDMRNTQTSAFNYKAGDILVGSNGVNNVYRSMVRFVNLPDIGNNATIVSAKMHITAYQGMTKEYEPELRPRPEDNIHVYVHRITSDWPEIGATWSEYANNYNPEVEDYFIYSSTEDGFTADITEAVSGWYNSSFPNYGLMLKAEEESSANHVMQFTSSDWGTNDSNAATWRPVLSINYRNCNGLEDYWSYSTYSADVFGTSYVNNSNGNLIYEYTDYENNTEINNYSIKHIYNSATADGATGHYGKGWNLNLVQTIKPIAETSKTNAKFLYIDGDGTGHYFIKPNDSEKIVDEDGLGYEYSSIDEGELIHKIKTKNDTVLKFDEWGYLRRIIDSNNNMISLNYSPTSTPNDNILTSITTFSASGVEADPVHLLYDSNCVLHCILKNNNIITTYTYDNCSVRHIERADGTGPYFWFTDSLSAVRYGNEQHYNYSYDAHNRISRVEHQDNQGVTKSFIDYEYKYNQTVLKDNRQRQMTYQFDTYSRPVCVFDSSGNTAYCDYSEKSDLISEIHKSNKPVLSGSSNSFIHNRMANGYMFFGTGGYTIFDISNGKGSIAQVTGEGLVTSSSLSVQMNGQITENEKIAVSQCPASSAGKTYTFSGYIKTDSVVPVNSGSEHTGALLKITTTQNREFYSEALIGTTDAQIDNGYQKVSVTFSLNENEIVTTASAGLFYASGQMYIDCLQFEENDSANNINIINNSSFERISDSLPISYGFTENAGITVSNNAQSEGHSLLIPGNTHQNKSVYQLLSQSGHAGDVYTFGAWAKANSVPNNSEHASFKEYITFIYSDQTIESFRNDFNPYLNDWQFVTKTVKAKKDYSQIFVYLEYSKNYGTALFDSVFLYRDTAQAYVYDSNGNIVASTDAASQNSSFQYTGNNLTKQINPSGTYFEYSYDSKNNLVTAKSDSGLKYNISYDSNGNPTSTCISSDNYSAAIQSDKQYFIRQKGSGKYLTAQGENSGANVSQETFSGSSLQKWQLEKTDGGFYYIKSVGASNNVLEVANGSNDNQSNIQIASDSGGNAQKFLLILKSDGSYKISPKSSEDRKILTVESPSSSNVFLNIYWGDTNDNQQWYFEQVQDSPTDIYSGVYIFRNRNSGKYLDATVSNNSLTQYYYDSSNKQKFKLHETVQNGETLYKIESILSTGCYLQVIPTENDMYNVRFTEGATGNGKLFRLASDENSEKYKIFDTTYNKCLAISFSSLDEGAKVIAVNDGSNATRYWILEKCSEKVINSSAEYSSNGQKLLKITDSRGTSTEYTYDYLGRTSSVTDSKGVSTNYTYCQGSNRLSSVSSGGSTVEYNYANDPSVPNNKLLSSIVSPSGTVCGFSYDNSERLSTVSIGSRTLSSNTYNADNNLSQMQYGNGAVVGYNYDNLDRVTEKQFNNTVRFEYKYNKKGNLVSVNDIENNIKTEFSYDLIGRLLDIKSTNGSKLYYRYDQYNRTNLIKYSIDDKNISLEYVYGSGNGRNNDLIYGIKQSGNTDIISYDYDGLSRLSRRVLNTASGFATDYTYLDGAEQICTTTMVKTVKNGDDLLEYSYDNAGNITEVKKNGTVAESYSYDNLNQLTMAAYGGHTYAYTYDNGGNILSVTKDGSAVKSYIYGDTEWKDLLTCYNGHAISYDGIGNPLTYRDGFNFTWSNGRELTGITKGTDSISYLYNADGLRTSKTVNGITTDYYWLNGILLGQKTGNEYILFLYDENGSAYGMLLNNGTTEEYYYYLFNAQGDITGIVDSNGQKVVEYTYGAWGDITAITGTLADTVGQINPIRYRGYYYDAETGFYLTGTRYYDPEIGRFINADGYVSTGQGILGTNMFAYCGNNPITRADPSGQFWGIVIGVTLVVGLVASLSGCSAKPKPKPEPYKSADDAARAFSEQVYSSSSYIRHEYSTEIYSRTINGKTTYNYNPPRAGNPHSASVGNSTPKGTKAVAYAHTHPNSNVFSGADIRAAENLKIDAYVVGPNLELQRYSLSSASTTNLGVISPIALTDAQRSSLVTEFQVSWDAHIADGCDFNCGSMTWPTP